LLISQILFPAEQLRCGIINTMLRALYFDLMFSSCCLRGALLWALFVLASIGIAESADIQAVELSFRGQELQITTALVPDEDMLNELRQGLSKEIRFAFELMLVKALFPDEYILGQKITVTLKSDPIKREFAARMSGSGAQVEKRFKDVESMVSWALSLKDFKFTNVKELDPGTYYVRVSAESRVRKLPPVIKYLLFFIPETEFKVWRYSQTFSLPPAAP